MCLHHHNCGVAGRSQYWTGATKLKKGRVVIDSIINIINLNNNIKGACRLFSPVKFEIVFEHFTQDHPRLPHINCQIEERKDLWKAPIFRLFCFFVGHMKIYLWKTPGANKAATFETLKASIAYRNLLRSSIFVFYNYKHSDQSRPLPTCVVALP